MLKNFWYACEVAAELKDKPRKVRVLAQDLVLYRDSKGTAVAMSDLCVHRGASLSGGSFMQAVNESPRATKSTVAPSGTDPGGLQKPRSSMRMTPRLPVSRDRNSTWTFGLKIKSGGPSSSRPTSTVSLTLGRLRRLAISVRKAAS